MHGKVWINGEIFAPRDARISVFDRGFLYGDSVFETLRVYGGVPFAFEEHLTRLFASGSRVGFELPWSREFLAEAVRHTLTAYANPNAYMRIIATRGSGEMGLDPSLAKEPTLMVMVLPLPHLPAELYSVGRSAALVSVVRNAAGNLDPMAKTGNYLNSVLAAQEAKSAGADEAIMLDPEGRIAEASAANVFALVNDVWCTPPLNVGILSGITRQTILRLCAEHTITCAERILWPVDLQRATEIFICASVREIVPIVSLNHQPVGDGQVGPRTQQIRSFYAQAVERYVQTATAAE